MAEPKKNYSVVERYYSNNRFSHSTSPIYFSSLSKAKKHLKLLARICCGDFYSSDTPVLNSVIYRTQDYTVVACIDSHLLF